MQPPTRLGSGGQPASFSPPPGPSRTTALYGLREKQFLNLFHKSLAMKGATGKNLLLLLERRLDNVVYRQGPAETRAQARKLVNHGHFLLNRIPTDIPTCAVRPGDVVSVAATSREGKYFVDRLGGGIMAHHRSPDWFETTGTDPLTSRIAVFARRKHAESEVNEQVIVEFYSR